MISKRLKEAIEAEKLKNYQVKNSQLLAKYIVMLSTIKTSASIGILDLMFFLVFTVIGALNHELVFSLISNFHQIFTEPLMFIETYMYPICLSLILVTIYSFLRNIDEKIFDFIK